MYLFMRDTHTEAETQADGEAGSMQGTRCGTGSGSPGSRPVLKVGAKLLSHPGCPNLNFKSTEYLWTKQ